MEPRALLLVLVLLPLPPLAAPTQGAPRAPEARDQLCGRNLLRALVRVCGGPRWSRETREPAAGGGEHPWHLFWPAADGDLQPLSQAFRHDRERRQAKATNPAQRCCLTGCTHQDLLRLCPH